MENASLTHQIDTVSAANLSLIGQVEALSKTNTSLAHKIDTMTVSMASMASEKQEYHHRVEQLGEYGLYHHEP